IRLGVRPRPWSGPTVTSFGRPEGVLTSRRSAVTGSLATVRETGPGPAAGAGAGASAGTVSNDIPSTRPKPNASTPCQSARSWISPMRLAFLLQETIVPSYQP